MLYFVLGPQLMHAVEIFQVQLVHLNVLDHSCLHLDQYNLHPRYLDQGCPHIDSPALRIMKINQDRGRTLRTKLVIEFFIAKTIILERIVSGQPFDLVWAGIDEHVAVLGANGAVAAENLMGGDGREEDFVFDGAAVAVGVVPDLLWLLFRWV